MKLLIFCGDLLWILQKNGYRMYKVCREEKDSKMEKIKEMFKKDPILYISGILAVISLFIVKPDKEYAGYINFRVIAILFSLMLIVGALTRIGTFDYLTSRLLRKMDSEKKLSLFLCVLAFFMSMLLTNDVTLVTLVPFAIMVLSAFNDSRRLMYTLILMTIAANLGSMLTPIGNPQNLYLYTEYGFSLGNFLLMMLPYTGVAFLLIVATVLWLNRTDKTADSVEMHKVPAPKPVKLIIYIALFILSILTVAGFVHYLIMLAVVTLTMLVTDKKAFKNVDYALLLTFCFFFVLIGNLGRIDIIYETLTAVVSKNVTLTAVLASQVISNVPAAILLSAFTDNGAALVIGTNLGGLGTLIASMASLITFKFYGNLKEEQKKGGNYLLSFTALNVIFLTVFMVMTVVI